MLTLQQQHAQQLVVDDDDDDRRSRLASHRRHCLSYLRQHPDLTLEPDGDIARWDYDTWVGLEWASRGPSEPFVASWRTSPVVFGVLRVEMRSPRVRQSVSRF